MIQSDLRKTNLVVDDTCTVRGKLVATNADIANTKIRTTTFSAPSVTTQTLQTQNIVINGTTTPTADFLFINTPSSIVANQIPEFTTNGSAEVKSVANTSTSSGSLDYLFMNGSDGNQTISTSQSMIRDMYFDTLTITSTGILDPSGFVIFCKTALINNGVIQRLANNGSPGSGGIGGVFANGATNGTVFGGLGSTSGGNTNTNGGSTSTSQLFGGLGGSGGNSDTKTGGTSTAVTTRYFNAPTPIRQLALFGEIFRLLTVTTNMLGFIPGLGGGSGAGGSAGAGGSGGAGGNLIVIVSKSVSGSGTFEAKGGNGGNGETTAGGGGGGGGGVVYIMSRNNTILSSQVLVSGGIAGTGGGSGGLNGVNGNIGLYQTVFVPS